MMSMLFSTLDTRLTSEDNECSKPPQQTNKDEQLPVLIILQQIIPFLAKIGLQWCQDTEIAQVIFFRILFSTIIVIFY